MQRVEPQPREHLHLIPDFCRVQAILSVAFSMEMVAIMLTLAAGSQAGGVLERFVLLSMFLQWLGLCGAAVLCLSRRWLRIARPSVVFFVCWGLLLVVTLVLSDAGYFIARQIADNLPGPRAEFILRNLCISAIVSLFLLRYFWVQNQWRDQVQREGESRYQALQARIRPHFLFNSLNSIAALITSKPEQAERMIEDLSDLFRASLEARTRRVPLRDEVEITRAYLRIEQVRLGERLRVEWDIPETLLLFEVPVLSLQPLAENAVNHGVARLPAGGTVRLRATEAPGYVILEIENPLPPGAAPGHQGLQVAVDNIAQRLLLIYGGRAQFEMGEEAGLFRARLRLPVTDREKS